MTEKTERISNPFPPVWDARCHVLILGSLPSEASRAAGFYYMNPRNRFWKVMTSLFHENFEAMSAEEKSAALLSHGIALSDVIGSCEIHRSADASIKKVVRNEDVEKIFEVAPVEKVLLNGGKAHALFLKHFPEHASLAKLLPSTSPANAKRSLDELVTAWRKAIFS